MKADPSAEPPPPTDRKRKVALISNVLPPSETAHAAIIERLLRDWNPDNYCLLSSRDYTSEKQPDYSRKLPGKYYYLPPLFEFRRELFQQHTLREQAKLVIALLARALAIARLLRREKCDAVVVCTGGNEVLDFPAGFLASRLTRIPFYAYLLDQYSHMLSWVLGDAVVLQHLEPWIMKRAAAVITPNEFLRDRIATRHGVKAKVIHNACDLHPYQSSTNERDDGHPSAGDDVRIVYTGAIGPLHYGAFKNLLAAVDLLPRRDVKLHVYTPQPHEQCEQAGIQGPVVFHPHQPLSAMPAIQKGSDLLFLALTFDRSFHDIVSTAAPGKMGEYLAARRPILVHAPADSFVAWYCREYECGLVVDGDDPHLLARELERMLTDTNLQERLAARAWERAQVDFDLPAARAKFAEVLGLDG